MGKKKKRKKGKTNSTQELEVVENEAEALNPKKMSEENAVVASQGKDEKNLEKAQVPQPENKTSEKIEGEASGVSEVEPHVTEEKHSEKQEEEFCVTQKKQSDQPEEKPHVSEERHSDKEGERTLTVEEKYLDHTGESSHKSHGKLILGIALGAVGLLAVAVLSIVYCRRAAQYTTCFLPNTTVNGIDCGEMEAETLMALLDSPISAYTLEVYGRDYATGESGAMLGTIVPEDIQLIFAGTKEAVETLLEQQSGLRWIFSYMGDSYTYDISRVITFDEKMLEDTIQSWDACRKQNMLHAKDAYISDYSDNLKGYEVIGETIGSELDMNRVVELVTDAIYRQVTWLDVEEMGCYEEAAIKSSDEGLQSAVEAANKWLSTNITYDWNGTEVVLDSEILKDWISIEENMPVLDEEAVAAFVKEQAAAYDTYGKSRRFRTSLGVELSLVRRSYGWKTNVADETEELIAMIYEGITTQREPLYVAGITARGKGANDIGNSYVEADLTNQHLYLYWEGSLVLETDFVSGDMLTNSATPQGIFGLTYKTRNAVLRGADYETFVSYWMPYFGNYGMHDATWRDEFGGDIYLTDGSHGCLNLPLDKAEEIYQYMSIGFPIICYYYEVNPLAVQEEEQETDPAEASAGD